MLQRLARKMVVHRVERETMVFQPLSSLVTRRLVRVFSCRLADTPPTFDPSIETCVPAACQLQYDQGTTLTG